MKFIAGLRVWVNRETGKTPQVFPRFRASANRRVDLHLPLIASIIKYGVLASGKLWKEEETRTLKPFAETLRVRIPPGRAGPAARSESCVVVGRPILRSVDSEVKGRVIEPREYKPRGAFVLDTGGSRVRQLTHGPLSLPDPAGVEEHGQ